MNNTTTSGNQKKATGLSRSNRSLAFLGVGAGLCCLAIISVGLIPTFLSGILFMLFALAIGFRQMFLIYVFLFVLFFAKFVFLPGFNIANSTLGLSEILFVNLVFAFYGFSVRYIDLANAVESIYPALGEVEQSSHSVSPYPNPQVGSGRWYFIPIAVLIGLALLLVIPLEIQNVRGDLMSRRATRLILIVLGIFICWFVSVNIIKFVARWQMKADQADVSIRSSIANELWRDQKRFEAYRYKRKRKR
ncbi:hypothetical protein N9B60_06300 [Mariniblastus sp.]|nr:hypothetical protein [Mariniblastus sp.]MDB4357373.1 hypothetical protein [Mariniblastus sp.]MDB4396249.1 hypothetical protein [bacterium]